MTNIFTKLKLELGGTATAYVDPVLVPIAVNTSFNKGSSITLPMASFQSSGDIVNSIIPSSTLTSLTFAVDVPNQTVTIGTVSSTFTGTVSGTFKLNDAFGHSSVSANISVTVSAVVTGGAILPPRIMGNWLFAYNAPYVAAIQSTAPQHNLISYFAAVGTGSGGTAIFNGGGVPPPSISEVAAWKSTGRVIILDIGGQAADVGNGATLTINTQADQDQMFNSLVGLVDTYGFQGVSFDMDDDTGQFTPTLMAGLINRLKTHYGQSFIIGLDPSPYQIRDPSGIYAKVYAATPNNIDLVSNQFYSQFGQTDDWFINQFIIPGINSMVNTIGIPARKLIIGGSTPGSGGAPSGASTYLTAYNTLVNTFPTLPGIQWWNSNDIAGGADGRGIISSSAKFSQSFTAAVGGTCTTSSHGYITGAGCYRASTTGTLPGGLSTNTDYCVINTGASTFQIATNQANALAGTFINLTSTGSGTHKLSA